jgi:hypothetical protein
MFRLTWDGPDALLKSMRPVASPQMRRVYRWENKWGFFIPSTGHWFAEGRVPVAHGQRGDTRFLLETVELLDDEAPPFAIDDVWEEEVVDMSNGSYAGISISLTGSAKELVAWCKGHGLAVPPVISSNWEPDAAR